MDAQEKVIQLFKGNKKKLVSYAFYVAMVVGPQIENDFPLQLLDLADQAPTSETDSLEAPIDFYRGIVYVRTGDTQKGKTFFQKTLDTFQDPAQKKYLEAFAKKNFVKRAAGGRR